MRLVTRRQDHADRRPGQPAAGEHQRIERRRIEPVHIVDAHQHRPFGRREQQHAQRRRAHQETVALDRRDQAQCPAKRVVLRARQLGDQTQQRAQHLQRPGKRDLRLTRDAGRPQHHELIRARRDKVQQRRLARARHAAQQHRAAVA